MELLLDSLKSEVYSDVDSYRHESLGPRELDYDEIFEDDDD